MSKSDIQKELKETARIIASNNKRKSEFYDINSLLGNQWALFYVLIGARP